MIYDPRLELARQRQQELRSLAAEVARGRRSREEGRPVERRPLHLQLVTLVFGPR